MDAASPPEWKRFHIDVTGGTLQVHSDRNVRRAPASNEAAAPMQALTRRFQAQLRYGQISILEFENQN
jgi:hypothetical protein